MRQHELIAEHVARSEKWVEVIGPGRRGPRMVAAADAARQPLPGVALAKPGLV